MNIQKSPIPRIAAIHDLSGYGRASLTVAIPILSTMGMQVCPLPTAILSSQTSGMESFSFFDLTSQMYEILAEWKKIPLHFDAIYSGFLGSAEQGAIVERCMREHSHDKALFLVDPVLGDEGELYATQTPELVDSMRNLVALADIVCPNYTEACFLLNETYRDKVSDATLKEYMIRLAELEPQNPLPGRSHKAKTVIITSAPYDNEKFVRVIAYEGETGKFWQCHNPRIDAFYPGTGDTFASVFLGACLQGDSIAMAMARASSFVYQSIMTTYGYNTHYTDGIMLERVLTSLSERTVHTYESF